MNPYGSLTRGQYTNDDVAAEIRRSGGAQDISSAYANYAPTASGVNYAMMSSDASPMDAYPSQAPPPPGPATSQEYTQMTSATPKDLFDAMGGKDGKLTREEFEWHMANYGQSQQIDPRMLEGAVDVRVREGRVVSERMVEQRSQVIAGVKPVYTVEKVVEVPQVIVREYEREVLRPEVVERIIEVPKTEIQERKVVGPPQVQYQEQIVEVPQVVVEERIVHVPKREIQERLIEIPKVEYVERIEYEDFIEYREVPVDKIIEVPEIEYRVREVEYLVPQTYIQEYYVDRYKEFLVTQVQEVERIEHVPVEVPPQGRSLYTQQTGFVPSQSMSVQQQPVAAPVPAQAMTAPAQAMPTSSQVQLGASYMTYGGTSIQQGQPMAPVPAMVYSQQAMPMQSGQYITAAPQNAVYSYASYDPTKGGDLFSALDKNGDGVLTAQELQTAQAAMGSQVGTQQYIVPRGSMSAMSPMAPGAMTPPMAPGYNPFASAYPSTALPVS